MEIFLYITIGLIAGAVIGYIAAKSQLAGQLATAVERARLAAESASRADAAYRAEMEARSAADLARTASETRAAETEKYILKLQEDLKLARKEFEDAFSRLSHAALKQASDEFLKLATQKLKTEQTEAAGQLDVRKKEVESLVMPIRESLTKLTENLQGLETRRVAAYTNIQQLVEGLQKQASSLGERTTALTESLRGSSQVRGRWGEVQLRNLVELSGMLNHCDFEEQTGITDGGRPDVMVKLPGGRCIAIDAKAPLANYLEAMQAGTPEARRSFLQLHSDAVRNHVKQLSGRAYWDKLGGGLDFVVLFLPGDSFLSAAFESDGDLFEFSVQKRVLIATPVTLLALLKTLSLYWQQSRVADNAREIHEVATELYTRIVNFIEPVSAIGKELQGAIDAYNKAVASFEGRILPFGRRLEELGTSEQARKKLPEPPSIETAARESRHPGR